MSLGAAGAPGEFEAAVAVLEAAGVDSLWLPETVFGPAVDPFTGMTFALAKTTHLKVGSGISVLPGRHPVLDFRRNRGEQCLAIDEMTVRGIG